ncbi:hypothetical protein [Clostridium sp. C2-6-12]|uniref:hypothetical protein n=1 Tax=Clostridium sp. C2-6-12 TaxID=2698832 RepID=UPI00137221AA|nr:hypothetical protein [Clostridium sp. C2-6-12]
MKSDTWRKKEKGVLVDDFIDDEGKKVNAVDHLFTTELWELHTLSSICFLLAKQLH